MSATTADRRERHVIGHASVRVARHSLKISAFADGGFAIGLPSSTNVVITLIMDRLEFRDLIETGAAMLDIDPL